MGQICIFISHISSERDLAQYLKQRLADDFLGLPQVFVSSDRETIQAGSKWLDEVDKALKSADLQIILCSKESVGRPWVNFEAGAVWLRGIPVIPLCHSGMRTNDLPVPLGMLEGLECGQPEELQKLYDAVAAVLGAKVPAVDFREMAAKVNELEKKYIQAREGPEIIKEPRILCAASEYYAQFGFNLDVAVLAKSFPKRVEIERKLTAKRLRELLTTQHFDIVHLVLQVDQKNGDLIFSPPGSSTDHSDIMPAKGFKDLLVESRTRLVVLATCWALELGAIVGNIVNIAATSNEITAEAAKEWAECFYSFLAQGMPLYKAFDMTESQCSTPIRAVRYKDVAFAVSGSLPSA
jgi:hypothetical protein